MTQIYDLVSETDPILRQELPLFKFDGTVDSVELAKNLIATMNHYNGLGLAANQCGLPYRVFVMKGNPNYVCFNPKIVSPSEELIILDEACLSFPGVVTKVKRPKHIRVRFTTPNGQTTTKTFTGMTARVFQHELDHLDGIVFYDRANRYHRERALKNRHKKVIKYDTSYMNYDLLNASV